eukprot:scaffold172_cov341-Pavlova_lutheri.AAC.16
MQRTPNGCVPRVHDTFLLLHTEHRPGPAWNPREDEVLLQTSPHHLHAPWWASSRWRKNALWQRLLQWPGQLQHMLFPCKAWQEHERSLGTLAGMRLQEHQPQRAPRWHPVAAYMLPQASQWMLPRRKAGGLRAEPLSMPLHCQVPLDARPGVTLHP